MKTLLVKYTARGQRSRTEKLSQTLIDSIQTTELEIVDLTQTVPELFVSENLQAYYERNYADMAINPEQQKMLASFDLFCAQFKAADTVVLATPMYNFSMPAIVKAYFDAVMQKGETFDISPNGYIGLMKGKKALILTTSGGVYTGPFANFEHLNSLAECEFRFMGFDPVESIFVQGANSLSVEEFENNLSAAQTKIQQLANKWQL